MSPITETCSSCLGEHVREGLVEYLDPRHETYIRDIDENDFIQNVLVALGRHYGQWYAIRCDGEVPLFYCHRNPVAVRRQQGVFTGRYDYIQKVPDTPPIFITPDHPRWSALHQLM